MPFHFYNGILIRITLFIYFILEFYARYDRTISKRPNSFSKLYIHRYIFYIWILCQPLINLLNRTFMSTTKVFTLFRKLTLTTYTTIFISRCYFSSTISTMTAIICVYFYNCISHFRIKRFLCPR